MRGEVLRVGLLWLCCMKVCYLCVSSQGIVYVCKAQERSVGKYKILQWP